MFGLREEEVTWDVVKNLSRQRGDYCAGYMAGKRTYILKGNELLIYQMQPGADELEWARIIDLRDISPITSPAIKTKDHFLLPRVQVLVVGEQFYTKHEPRPPLMIPSHKAFHIQFPEDMELLSYEDFEKFRNTVLSTIVSESIKKDEWDRKIEHGLAAAERISEFVMKRLAESGDFELGVDEVVAKFAAGESWNESLFHYISSNRLPFYFYCYRDSDGGRIAVESPNHDDSVAFRIRDSRDQE